MSTRLFNRNFNILLSGMFVKGIGTGVYEVAGMLLVLAISGNVFYSGLAYFAISAADCLGFLIAPFANYVSYKKSLVFCEFLKSALLFSIPLFAVLFGLNVFYCILVLFIVAMISQFTYPVESTVIPNIVPQDRLVQANSYLNTLRESMNIVFLAVAGILVAVIGPVQAILITAICHLCTSLIYTLYRFDFQNTNGKEQPQISKWLQNYKQDFMAGIRYITGSSIIPHLVVACFFVNFFIAAMFATLPAFALMQGGSESYYGYYMAAMSVGLLCGAIITPRVGKFPFGKLTVLCGVSSGLLWVGASLLPVIPSIALYGAGFVTIGIFNVLMFSAIQRQIETSMIGRVITVVSSAAAFSMPIGALVGGAIGSISPLYSILLGGIAMVIFGMYWLVSGVLRKLPSIDQLELSETATVPNSYHEPVKDAHA